MWKAINLLIVAGLFVGGCAETTKPLPVRIVKNLESISGQWEGSAVGEKGKPFKFKVTIGDDGSYSLVNGTSHSGGGVVRIVDGLVQLEDSNSERDSIYTLHEDRDEWVLTGPSLGGSPATLRRRK